MRDLHPATVTDLIEAATWIGSADEAAFWAGHRVSYPIDLELLEEDLEFAHASSWALAESGDLVGFGQVVPKAEGRRHIARLIVDPARRGCGFGRVLAAHLVRAAQDLGGCRISLNVDPSNVAALSLYIDLGFVEADRPLDEPRSASLYLERAE
jgi:ribosomal protein S18 acetylase RimI-like enzyme